MTQDVAVMLRDIQSELDRLNRKFHGGLNSLIAFRVLLSDYKFSDY